MIDTDPKCAARGYFIVPYHVPFALYTSKELDLVGSQVVLRDNRKRQSKYV